MQRKHLIATFVAAFALPLAANAAGTGKQADAQANSAKDGGAEAMFGSLDKNGDGFISKEEAAGTPHAADFATLDKNGDGKLSREEHAAAKEHVAARAKAGSTGSTASSTSGSTDTSSSKKTY